MSPILKTIIESALDMVFPPLCYSCSSHIEKDEAELNICEKCRARIKTFNHLFCPICKQRIPFSPKSLQPCRRHTKFTLAACADYKNPQTRKLIHTLKYKKIENAICPITELLIKPYVKASLAYSFTSLLGKTNQADKNDEANETNKLKAKSWIIVPIPLHPSKKRSRGFNQSELIANALRKCLEVRLPREVGLPDIKTSLLVRTKSTEPQIETKTREEREQNVKACFKINTDEADKALPALPTGRQAGRQVEINKTIILVDDVYTSGETMKEAVRTLKRAGAKRIIAFVLAKT